MMVVWGVRGRCQELRHDTGGRAEDCRVGGVRGKCTVGFTWCHLETLVTPWQSCTCGCKRQCVGQLLAPCPAVPALQH